MARQINNDWIMNCLISYSSFETQYGTMWLIQFRNTAGHMMIWKTNPNSAYNVLGENPQRGDQVTVKASIKEHNDYKGTKQTVLTRLAAI